MSPPALSPAESEADALARIVVRGASPLSALLAQLDAAVPQRLRRWLAGPANLVHIDLIGSRLEGRRHWLRPVEVVVDPGLILTRKLSLPTEAKADLRHAVGLFIRSATPFGPEDLLIEVAPALEERRENELSFHVRFIPKTKVLLALRASRFRAGQVRRVAAAGDNPLPGSDFALALLPRRRWTRWLPALPVAIIFAVGAIFASSEVGWRRAEADALMEAVSARLVEVSALTREIEAREAATSDALAPAKMFAKARSAFLTLRDIQAARPEAAEIMRIEERADGARLSVRAPDVLREARAFEGALANWKVSIEGSIAADAATGFETAVFLMQPVS